MRESPEELVELQRILDESHAESGAHLRSIFGKERLDAEELTATLTGIIEVHLAALAGDGAPLVAPIDALLFHGKIWFGVPSPALRARLVRRDPRVSASYVDGSFGLIVHGGAREATPGGPEIEEFEALTTELYVARYGPAFLEWQARQRAEAAASGEGFTGWIEPRRLFAKR